MDRGRLQPGEQVGRYIVLEPLGAGGMGEVFAAHDPELDRKVAVKLIHTNARAGTQGRQRLVREARALARLNHPNVVEVFDVGVWGSDVFVAMELVAGRTLTRWWSTPRSWTEVLGVMIPAGRGLAAAHVAGLVHRDFKPANVLVDDEGRVKVLDFGLARGQRELSEGSDGTQGDPAATDDLEGLTRTGVVMGTPMYMAPEQHSAQPMDARADQFAFCVTLYEALTGVPPFRGSTATELAKSKAKGRVTPLPSMIPSRISAAVLRGLRCDPAQRFPTMEALLAELEPPPRRWRGWLLLGAGVCVAAGLAVAVAAGSDRTPCADTDEVLDTMWNDERAHRVATAITATGVTGAEQTWARAKERIDAHAEALRSARQRACEATHVEGTQPEHVLDRRMACVDRLRADLEALLGVLEQADAASVRRVPVAVARLEQPSRCADVDALQNEVAPPEDPAVAAAVGKARAQLSVAHALEEAGRYEAGVDKAQAVLAEAEKIGYAPLVAEARYRLARLQEKNGRYEAAEALLREVAFEAESAGDDRLAAKAMVGLVAVVGYRRAEHDQARRWARDARAAIARLRDAGMLEAQRLNNLGLMETKAGRPRVALQLLTKALAERRRVLASDHVDLATGLLNLGNAHHQLGDNAAAAQAYEQALEIWVSKLGPDHPDVAGLHVNLGNIARARGEQDEARSHFEEALRIWEETLPPTHPDLAMGLMNVAAIIEQEDPQQASRHFDRACAILEGTLGSDHPEVAKCLSNHATILLGVGRFEDAEKRFARALTIVEAQLGAEHIAATFPMVGLGNARIALGDARRAADVLDRALQLRRANPEATDADLAEAEYALARALGRLGQQKRAMKLALAARARALQSPVVDQNMKDELQSWIDEHSPNRQATP